MSKKKDKKDGAHKIPKRIAGVKLPKEVRRKGEALIEAAGSPAGREVIAKGLTMAAALATLAAQRGRAAEAAAAEPEGVAGDDAKPAPAAPLDPQKMVEAVTTVADAVLGRLFPVKKA